jgi:energy-converting hydrogenase Eha subunit H
MRADNSEGGSESGRNKISAAGQAKVTCYHRPNKYYMYMIYLASKLLLLNNLEMFLLNLRSF